MHRFGADEKDDQAKSRSSVACTPQNVVVRNLR